MFKEQTSKHTIHKIDRRNTWRKPNKIPKKKKEFFLLLKFCQTKKDIKKTKLTDNFKKGTMCPHKQTCVFNVIMCVDS